VSPKSRIFAAIRQFTGLPYLYGAYVYEGNRVVMSCTHHHGERRAVPGTVSAQRCADRMLRKVLKQRG
jgi:hypothetical protein